MKLIIHGEPHDWGTALDAAHWLVKQPPQQRDAILAYGNSGAFYVRRNKASVTSRKLSPQKTADGTER